MKIKVVMTSITILGGISICNAAPVENFMLPMLNVPTTIESAKSIELPPAEIQASVSKPTPVLVVKGSIAGDAQTFIISGNQLVCGFSDNKTVAQPGIDGLIPAREMYFDSIFKAWIQTGDIREACPSEMQHVCTAGVIYNCKHTIVPNSHQESRPCSATEIDNGKCPSNGMVWVPVTVNECHVSCTATSKPC